MGIAQPPDTVGETWCLRRAERLGGQGTPSQGSNEADRPKVRCFGIGYDPKVASWNFPLPWPGGRWRLRDVLDYQHSATRALLEHAAAHREMWLRSFLGVNRRAVARRDPLAFVVSAEQKDPLAAAHLLDVLGTAGVEIHRAPAAFDAAGAHFPSGSHVVLMAQPVSVFAKMVLETQHYPDLRKYPGGPPQRPYDATAHTLPLLMGVDVRAVAELQVPLEKVSETRVPPGRVEGHGRFLALGHGSGEMIAMGRLLRRGIPVRWALEAFGDRGRRFEAGALIAPESARETVESAARDLGIAAQAVDALPRALLVKKPRLGVYQSWVPSMDEGWTRFVLEKDVGVDYVTVHDADLNQPGLASRFDAILLPDQAPKAIVEGQAPGTLPEEYTGGLGEEGVRNLRRFVEAGGTLIALNAASRLPVEDFELGVRNTLPSQPTSGEVTVGGVYAPGALLRVSVDTSRPLAHGLGPTAAVWFEAAASFEGGNAVATYADTNPLLSGWLLGGENLKGRAALVEAPLGKGRVVLFGFRPQYRAQSWGTYVALLNAIYLSAATPAR